MRLTIKLVVAVCAGCAAFLTGYLLMFPVAAALLEYATGEPRSNIELYSEFLTSPFLYLVAVLVGSLAAISAIRWSLKAVKHFGVPGLVNPYYEALPDVSITIYVQANGTIEDNKAPIAPFDPFTRQVSALELYEFMRGKPGGKLVLKQKNGIYLVLERPTPSAYEDDTAGDDAFRVRLMTRTRMRHNLETPFGEVGKYFETEPTRKKKKLGCCRFQLDYIGSETKLYPYIQFQGDPRAMKMIFLGSAEAPELRGSDVPV